MARVLIIDSRDERRKSLAARLRGMGMIVSAMAMIANDNLTNIITSYDALVLLEQNDLAVRDILNANTCLALKIFLTNHLFINDLKFRSNIYLIQEDDFEDGLVRQIQEIYLNKNKIEPIAVDTKSLETLNIARKVARTKATVLITGETGTGKEVLARYIHSHSPQVSGPFISVNCAALPENMLEAVLFGYEKGSFTSAINAYVGKFEQANNGTLFLDEISELQVGLQAKLLRAIQEREIERIGGKRIIKISIRIIAATNKDLKREIQAGNFRSDLFYRLNVLPVICKPLRERKKDIIPMAEDFIKQHSVFLERSAMILSDEAKTKLVQYNWPGNIRELDNIIQRALIMSEGDIITEADLDINLEFDNINSDQFDTQLEANEAKVIIEILNEADGCRNTAAKKLNISPRTLRYKIAKLKSIGVNVP